MCIACSTQTPPASYCPRSGVNFCLAHQACERNCLTCIVPTEGGDNCRAPLSVTTRGASRRVFTTCNAADDMNLSCGRTGNDIVLAFRVASPGNVNIVMTAPAGVDLFAAFDRSTTCASESRNRQCLGSNTSNTRTLQTFIALPGDYYLYMGTSEPATVVVDFTLP